MLTRVYRYQEFYLVGFKQTVFAARQPGQHFLYYLQLARAGHNGFTGEMAGKNRMCRVEDEDCAGLVQLFDTIKIIQQHQWPGLGGGGGAPCGAVGAPCGCLGCGGSLIFGFLIFGHFTLGCGGGGGGLPWGGGGGTWA